MTLYEVADYLHCSYYTVQKLARRGKIPGFRLLGDNGTWRVLKSELERWIAKGGGLR
jgi:excisionase family DNA binding protein